MARNCQVGDKSVLVIASHDRSTSATNRDFYTPRLFATPTEATLLLRMRSVLHNTVVTPTGCARGIYLQKQ